MEKLKIYDAVIARYKDSKDYRTQKIADEAIADKFRLLDPAAAKP